MNILMLNYEFPPIGGGAATVSKDMARMFIEAGHHVTVITMGFEKLPEHEKEKGIEIFRVPCLRSKKAVCYPWEQLTFIFAAVRFLRKHLKSNVYDINHTHFIIPTGVVSLWLKNKYRLPYVITSHGSDVPGYNMKRFKVLHKFLRKPWKSIVHNSKYVVSPSKYLEDLLLGADNTYNYTIIRNGIRVGDYKPEVKEQRILSMCRLQKTKDVELIIRAFAKADIKGWILDIAGDGPCKKEQMELVEKLGIPDSVVFHGWVENKSEKHISLLGKAAIYVSASYFENGPISVLEAIASKCYPILSDIPPHRSLVEKEKYIFPVGNENKLCEKLADVIKEKSYLLPCEVEVDWSNPIIEYLELFQKCKNKEHNKAC